MNWIKIPRETAKKAEQNEKNGKAAILNFLKLEHDGKLINEAWVAGVQIGLGKTGRMSNKSCLAHAWGRGMS